MKKNPINCKLILVKKVFNVFMIIIEKYETYQKRIISGNYFIKEFTF